MSDSSGILVVEAVSTARPGWCPNCRKQARRIHSAYQRTSGERPLGSRRVIVRLRVRRYFRDSTGLAGWLRAIAMLGSSRDV
ncbi:transposase family protein [Streptomyces justiciae]|uniref:Transposase family protein n=1 Tax=Streptomyces justiciae TaxID=2780140 RepID=A0ABU3M5D0_9ACTN|nr:transposase family protein [Streptomyces justiciae]MDT7846710.1 transposase family protein [Streptomyces justiciae]